MGAATSCLVADEHPAMVAAVGDVLAERGIDVVARARDGEDALTSIRELVPVVAVVDVNMPRLSGIELARRAREDGLPTAVVIYTAFADRPLLVQAMEAGARGFVLKEAPLDDLVRAVQVAAAGGVYVDPVLAGALAGRSAAAGAAPLTRRELDVLRLLADGRSNDAIGKELGISPETVRSHVRKAMEKLGAETRTQAVATALRRSLMA